MLHEGRHERLGTMSKALAQKLEGFFPVTDAVRAVLEELCVRVREFEPGASIIREGQDYEAIFLVDSGWTVRSRTLENGARQIVNVAIPGDFVGLNAMLFRSSEFDHVAKNFVTAFEINPDAAKDALGRIPNLATALAWANAHEESILAERIVSLGRRSARARAAHVLCELVSRLEIIDLVTFPELLVPLSQEDFADILGISLVHMNKVLRTFDRDGVISFRNGMLIIYDRKALERIAGFDGGYLQFTRRPHLIR
ncbi:Crp/Fnr family transcriptional regulator [Rubrimonas cliftonensis]|uniref:Transcriptional regulator, Crp/Fnr family n=1 Tax=Rubrimonas cliftonensis TaxID=89524 RepID=A0A1H4CHJ2_9RHOB|nr:Crp/Fnr family transcriptional regulator [Rubrimonas cliftonensis]SEA59810.1 transcriptional regulator, Crp/Fnr family [Rubrimonas cliftonensis]